MQSGIFGASNLRLLFASLVLAGMLKSLVSGISELLVWSSRLNLKGSLQHPRNLFLRSLKVHWNSWRKIWKANSLMFPDSLRPQAAS